MRTPLASFLVTAPLLALVFAGCSAKTNGGGTYDPTQSAPVSQEQYCEAYGNEVCSILVGCCSSAGLGGDVAKCKAAFVPDCVKKNETNAAAGRVYNAQAAGACIAGLRYTLDGCVAKDSTDATAKLANQQCSSVWAGNVALGGVCKSSTDCAKAPSGDTVSCVFTSSGTGTSTGTCTAQVKAKIGETCGSKPGTTGAYIECVEGAICKYTTATSGPGTYACAARGTRGQTCDPNTYKSCADGVTCDPTSKTCTDPLPLGSKCSTLGGSGTTDTPSCAAPNHCDSTTRICSAPKEIGAACVPFTSSLTCGAGNYCDSTTKICASLKADGAACKSSTECTGGRCSSSKCGPKSSSIASPEVCAVANGGPVPGSSTGSEGSGGSSSSPSPSK